MKKVLFASLVTFISAWGAWQLYGDPPPQVGPDRLKPFMQRKLDHSKAILEGLALEDFKKIAENSQALSLLSLESSWNVLTTEEYLRQSMDFRRALRVITSGAREKNVDRAALGYVNLTVRCVECHSYLRNNGGAAAFEKDAQSDTPANAKP